MDIAWTLPGRNFSSSKAFNLNFWRLKFEEMGAGTSIRTTLKVIKNVATRALFTVVYKLNSLYITGICLKFNFLVCYRYFYRK